MSIPEERIALLSKITLTCDAARECLDEGLYFPAKILISHCLTLEDEYAKLETHK